MVEELIGSRVLDAEARVTKPAREVIYIANVGKGCRIFTSEAQRMEGFRRYLPEGGWNVRALVKDCNCLGSATEIAGEVALRGGEARGSGDWRRELAGELADTSLHGAVMRMPCAARPWYRWWIRAAERTGWGFASAADSAEILHFLKPLPSLAGRIAGRSSPIQRLVLLPVKAAGLWVSRQDDQDRIDWVARAAQAGEMLAERGGVQAVIGSFPAVQNLEAAAEIARRTGLPWIADFRDSVKGGWCCGPAAVPRVRRVLQSASAILYTSEEFAADDASVRGGRPYTVVANGYLDEDIAQVRMAAVQQAQTAFTIRFLGTLYPMRNLDLFLHGFKAAVAELDPGALRFEYYGASEQAARDACARLELLPYCTIRGPVGRREALELTAAATVLVLPTNTVGHAGVPGAKLYEYLGVQRPILAAGGPDAQVERILSATRTGECCHSPAAVSRVLRDWCGRWRATGRLELDLDEREIGKYSRRNSAQELARVLDAVS